MRVLAEQGNDWKRILAEYYDLGCSLELRALWGQAPLEGSLSLSGISSWTAEGTTNRWIQEEAVRLIVVGSHARARELLLSNLSRARSIEQHLKGS